MHEAIAPFPQYASRRGAQLKKQKYNFTFFIYCHLQVSCHKKVCNLTEAHRTQNCSNAELLVTSSLSYGIGVQLPIKVDETGIFALILALLCKVTRHNSYICILLLLLLMLLLLIIIIIVKVHSVIYNHFM
jgi:hypothetical protein